MASVRGKDTAPELLVRRLLHRSGLRFRLHRAGLPGHPDIVLSRLRVVVFVHGCFWHRHSHCRRTTTPAANRQFWVEKFRANRLRDRRVIRDLERLGWRSVIVWECETTNEERLRERLAGELREAK
jgi:DNA mismatch endonuclease (patch repair protein)